MAETSKQIERCKLPNGDDQMCVLISGHKGEHRFKEVSILNGEPLFDAFCPYCGSRPALEGPGCTACGGQP